MKLNRIRAAFIPLFLCLAASAWADPLILDDIPGMNDEFDVPETLADWKNAATEESEPSRIEAMDIDKTEHGGLYFRPTEGIWWRGFHGVFLHKTIDGDFVVTTRVKVTGRDKVFPDYRKNNWQIAGIMLRKPIDVSMPAASRVENWVFNTFGAGIMEKYLFDVGETRDNKYTCFPFFARRSEWVELRSVRFGKYLIAMKKYEGGKWDVLVKLERPDLPSTLQVGMMANSSGYQYPFSELAKAYDYAAYDSRIVELAVKPNLEAYFDYMRFKKINMTKEAFDDIWTQDSKIIEHFGF